MQRVQLAFGRNFGRITIVSRAVLQQQFPVREENGIFSASAHRFRRRLVISALLKRSAQDQLSQYLSVETYHRFPELAELPPEHLVHDVAGVVTPSGGVIQGRHRGILDIFYGFKLNVLMREVEACQGWPRHMLNVSPLDQDNFFDAPPERGSARTAETARL